MVLVWLMTAAGMQAQDVTISPTSGRLIAGLGQSNEVGFLYGWKSLWWHNQLPLKIITSDEPKLNSELLPVTHGCNLSIYQNDIVVSSLSPNGNCYLLVTLPVGLRFTGYELVLQNNIADNTNVNGQQQMRKGNEQWYICETGQDYDTSSPYEKTDLGTTASNNEYTIKRNSLDADDMGSNLFFVFHGNADNSQVSSRNPFAMVRIKKFVVYFSAEANFTVPVRPIEDDDDLRAVRKVAFPTGKIALGDIRKRTQYGTGSQQATHYAYEYHEVEELDANMLLYNTEAVAAGGSLPDNEAQEPQQAKTITQEVENFGTADVQHAFGVKNGTYFIESPTEVVTTHGNHDPLGYRITGAKLHYYYGKQQAAVNETFTHNQNMFTISAQLNIDNVASNGQMTYYLHPSGRFVRAQSGETTTKLWQIDPQGRIYHYQDGEYTYLEWYLSGSYYYIRVYSTSTDPSNTYSKIETTGSRGNTIRQQYRTDNSTKYYNTFSIAQGTNNIRFGQSTNSYHYLIPSWDSNLAAYKIAQSQTASSSAKWKTAQSTRQVQQPAYTPKPWTLTVYAEDGTTVAETINVNEQNKEGTVTIEGLNNDAVKFSISGLPADDEENSYRALFNAELTMQALDPYITSLDIVCENNQINNEQLQESDRRIIQSFTATDFNVHGGLFKFYVPEKWGDPLENMMPCTFSFQNLHTNYLDNTYYNNQGTGHARNNLVGSEYYGTTTNAEGNPSVDYKSLYTVSEPNAEPTHYTKKVTSYLRGTQPFYFSNSDELDHDIAGNDIRTLHQYPFSVEAYRNQQVITRTTGNGTTITTGQPAGEFTKLVMDKDHTEHAYLFVCDEPRYNIAPTTATEHRLYSYYDMEIQLITKNFKPDLTWTKVYDEVQFANSSMKIPSQWGLTLKTMPDDDGNIGYLPYSVVDELITERIEDTSQEPNDRKQILYVDASPLSGLIYARNTGNDDNNIVKLRKSLAPNSLFFLPLGLEQTGNNFCHLDDAGKYHANDDIVFEDQQPFFSPYEIVVDASHRASYTRRITPQTGYGTYTRGTVLLPFNLEVDNEGIHRDPDGRCSFKLFNMNETNALSVDKSELSTGAVGYFSAIKSEKVVSQSEANKPYFFEMIDKLAEVGNVFVAAQKGATIAATGWKQPSATDAAGGQTTFTGTSSTGTISSENNQGQTTNTTYNLTPTGTFTGAVIPKEEGAFYMAQGKFLNALSLNQGLDALNMLPFRSWFTCKTNNGSSPSLTEIYINWGENPDTPTSISTISANDGLIVIPGKGQLSLLSDTSREVDIYAVNGMKAAHVSLTAAQRYTIMLQPGIYTVNQTKVVIR